VQIDRALEEALRRGAVSPGCEQEVRRLAEPVDGPLE